MPPRFKELYKPRPTNSDVRHRRLLHESQLRQLQREQLFMGKRLRLRTPQESGTYFYTIDKIEYYTLMMSL
ncbi:hypothetical protein IW143_003419 [Coemansia sp. RSA 520]|nr:hypothetical protein IW143_003419 [Coemansia sp. RSA 520]KAJ2427877.1 hypothetical protein IWW41_003733 [Coemansia sp. RSA 2522]